MRQKGLLISMIAIVTAIIGAIFLFRDRIKEKAQEQIVAAVLEGFSSETAQTRFLSYATTIAPLKRLEIAKINQLEVFDRTSQVKIFWDHFNLPEVVVRATVPVEYRYYIELDGQWRMDVRDNSITVLAPALLSGAPSPDISQLKFEVKKRSFFRNEVKVAEALQKDLTDMLRKRAQQSSSLVRETARAQVVLLVKQWLASESKSADISVRFADETTISN